MDFDIYPESRQSPEHILANGESPMVQIDAAKAERGLCSGSNPVEYDDLLFIRVAMLDPIPEFDDPAKWPTLCVQATAPGGETGEIVEINHEGTSWQQIKDGSQEPADSIMIEVKAGYARGYGHTGEINDNVYLFNLAILKDNREWHIRIKNNDSVDRDFTWVVAGKDEHSQQSWIDIDNSTVEFNTLANQSQLPTHLVTVCNKGTGLLELYNDDNTDPPTLLTQGDQLGSEEFTAAVSSTSIRPNGKYALEIAFNPLPGTIGSTNANYLIKSNDPTQIDNPNVMLAPEHNRKLEFKGIVRQLEVVLLLDGSGSMACDPQGNMGVPITDSRWSHLTDAVDEFLNLLMEVGEGTGMFGVAVFPNIESSPFDYQNPSASSLPYVGVGGNTEIKEITPVAIEHAKDAVDPPQPSVPRQPKGRTPMGKGIEVTTGLEDAYGYFKDGQTERDYNERWLILMSDGEHNWDPPHPHEFFRPGEGFTYTDMTSGGALSDGKKRTFQDKSIKVLTIGFGNISSPIHVNHDLLKLITARSGVDPGVYHHAAQIPPPDGLAKSFRSFIKNAFTLTSMEDPHGILTGGEAPTRHQTIVTPYDSKVIFVVNWSNYGRDRVEVSLVTPLCELITPKDALQIDGLSYYEHNRYKMFIVEDDYLRNNRGQSRHGTWTLVVSGQHLDEGDSEPYAYEIITRSRAQMAIEVNGGMFAAGDIITITATMTIDGTPIQNPSFTLHVTEPQRSEHKWLAHTHVRWEDFDRWKKELAEQDANALDLKARAAADLGLRFEDIRRSRSIPMVREGESSCYTASISNTAVPGTYELRVTAVAEATSGVTIRRERTVAMHIGMQPKAEHILVHVDYKRVSDASGKSNEASVWFMPRDHLDNVVLVDPKNDPNIRVTAEGADPAGDLVGHLDGSYSRTFQYALGTEPTINLQVGGKEVITKANLAPVERLRYINRVIDFTKGRETEESANQHDQPQAILGSILDKDGDTFVSLGGFGSITVGFDGESILVSDETGDEITIFVRKEEDLCPFAVEAQPSTNTDEWVELGTSAGITQSFSLGRVGLRQAVAIRITDRSGRIIDSEGKPSATPGVSIRGVGAKRVGRVWGYGVIGCLLSILRIFTLRFLFRR